MNAIRRELEDAVLTHEAIEVHLSYLRPAVEALSQKLDDANKDRAAADAALAEKIDQANRDRAAGDALLADKIDLANKDRAAGDAMLAEKIAAGDAMLAEKIDRSTERAEQTSKRLIEQISKLQGSVDGIKWFITSVALILSGFAIAHELGWI